MDKLPFVQQVQTQWNQFKAWDDADGGSHRGLTAPKMLIRKGPASGLWNQGDLWYHFIEGECINNYLANGVFVYPVSITHHENLIWIFQADVEKLD